VRGPLARPGEPVSEPPSAKRWAQQRFEPPRTPSGPIQPRSEPRTDRRPTDGATEVCLCRLVEDDVWPVTFSQFSDQRHRHLLETSGVVPAASRADSVSNRATRSLSKTTGLPNPGRSLRFPSTATGVPVHRLVIDDFCPVTLSHCGDQLHRHLLGDVRRPANRWPRRLHHPQRQLRRRSRPSLRPKEEESAPRRPPHVVHTPSLMPRGG